MGLPASRSARAISGVIDTLIVSEEREEKKTNHRLSNTDARATLTDTPKAKIIDVVNLGK